jgi:hypothetical protein
MMGYRSDVVALFYTTHEKAAAMKLYVDENFPEGLKDCLRPVKNSHHEGYMFSDSGVRWYPDYPEVKAFEKFKDDFIKLGDNEEVAWSYEFARIGENTDDIEEYASDFADRALYVARTIESDF